MYSGIKRGDACLTCRARSYVARSVSSNRPHWRRRDRGRVLSTAVLTVVKLNVRAKRVDAQAGRAGRDSIPRAEGCRRAGGHRTQRGEQHNELGLTGCDRFEVGHLGSSRVRSAEWLNSRGTSWEEGQH